MSELKYITIIYICFIINYARSEDKYGIINSKRTINIVDEKFLSISVDPAILLSGVKIRPATQQIATLLSPAYLRLSGPSTAYIDFDTDDSRATSRITESTDRLLVTPGSLATVNRWIAAANLTPVFALNDWKRVTTEDTDKWDTKQAKEMLEEIAKGDRVWLGECYWQLGYDNSNKTKHQYKEDIKTFREILDAFPEHAEYWKILGSDFTNCIGIDQNNIESMRNELIGVDAIIWERNNLKDDEHFAEQMAKAMMYETPVWTACPKTSNPISFESAILWAHQIGKAATEGFKVIFRQPRIHEFFTDTPPFWVSYLHKKLMGRNVLDIKTLDDINANVSVFAHCAKKQNNFPKGGAITILIVNNSTEEQKVNIKFSGVLSNSKTTYEVQSFILEAYDEDQSSTMLNGKKLTLNEIENNREFIPKLRRARLNRNLIFDIPRKSIGFYLLPGARLPVCISNEDEEDLILKEIIADQCIQFDEEHGGIQVKPRITERKANLNDLYQMVEKELETDESYYKIQAGLGGKLSLAEKIKELKTKKSIEDDSKFVFDMPKIIEVKSVDQRVQGLKNKIKEKMESKKLKNDSDLTNNEMVNVLKERAISNIEKSNVLSESDLEDFIHGVINLKSRQKRNANHGRRRIPSRTFARIHHGPANPHNVNQYNRNRNILRRPRRDINMDLLKSKTICTNCNDKLDKSLFKSKKSQFESNGEIQATLRLPGQTSLELLTDSIEEDDDDDEEKIPSEVFAELAKPTERAPDDISNFFAQNDEAKKTSFTWDDSMLKLKPKVDFSNIFQIPKLKPIVSNKPQFEIKPRTAKIDDDDKYMDEIDSLESLEEDGLNKYHGFFEELGDTIALEKSKDIDKGKEYSEHESEMNEEAKNFKEKLDNLLNDKKSTIGDDFYTDDIFRRKREVKEYTEEDVTFYKKLMQSNIKHMREQMARNRLRNGMDNLNTGFPRFFQARGGNINQGIKNRDSGSKKDKMEDLKIEKQKKMLKARLNNRKKLEETRNQGKHLDTLLSKLKAKSKSNKDLVNTNNLRRRKRSIMGKLSQNFDELYEPNVRLENTLHAYEPIVQLKNDFVPERRKSKKYTIEIVDDIDLDKQQKTVPIHTPELKEKFLAKNKRYTTKEDEFDMFQDISNIFNVIEKDSTFMKPFLDEESGEYDIVFPTKDEIKLIRNRGLTEIEFLHKTTEKATTENQADKETCTANYPNKKGNLGSTEDFTAPPKAIDFESENINSNLVEYDELTSTEYINVYIGQEKINEFVIGASNTEGGINSSTKETTVTSNIENIPMDGERNCSKIDMIETVFGQFKNIFDTIASTLKKYVHIFHENGRNEMKNETGIES